MYLNNELINFYNNLVKVIYKEDTVFVRMKVFERKKEVEEDTEEYIEEQETIEEEVGQEALIGEKYWIMSDGYINEEEIERRTRFDVYRTFYIRVPPLFHIKNNKIYKTDLKGIIDAKEVYTIKIPDIKTFLKRATRVKKTEQLYKVKEDIKPTKNSLYEIDTKERTIWFLYNISRTGSFQYIKLPMLYCNQYGQYTISYKGTEYTLKNLAIKRIKKKEMELKTPIYIFFEYITSLFNQIKLFKLWLSDDRVDNIIKNPELETSFCYRSKKSNRIHLDRIKSFAHRAMLFKFMEFNKELVPDNSYKKRISNSLIKYLYDSYYKININLNVSNNSFRPIYIYKHITDHKMVEKKFTDIELEVKNKKGKLEKIIFDDYLDPFFVGERGDLGNVRILKKGVRIITDLNKEGTKRVIFDEKEGKEVAIINYIPTYTVTGYTHQISELSQDIPYLELMSPKRINVSVKNQINAHIPVEAKNGFTVKVRARLYNPFDKKEVDDIGLYMWDGGVVISERCAGQLRYMVEYPISVDPVNLNEKYIDTIVHRIRIKPGKTINDKLTTNQTYITKTDGWLEIKPNPIDYDKASILEKDRYIFYLKKLIEYKNSIINKKDFISSDPSLYDIAVNTEKKQVIKYTWLPFETYINQIQISEVFEQLISEIKEENKVAWRDWTEARKNTEARKIIRSNNEEILRKRIKEMEEDGFLYIIPDNCRAITFNTLAVLIDKLKRASFTKAKYKEYYDNLERSKVDIINKISEELGEEFASEILKRIKTGDNVIKAGKLTKRPPGDIGICVIDEEYNIKYLNTLKKMGYTTNNNPISFTTTIPKEEKLKSKTYPYISFISDFTYFMNIDTGIKYISEKLIGDGKLYFGVIDEKAPIRKGEDIKIYYPEDNEYKTVSKSRHLREGDKIITKSGGKWIISKILPNNDKRLKDADIIVPINKINSNSLFAEMITNTTRDYDKKSILKNIYKEYYKKTRDITEKKYIEEKRDELLSKLIKVFYGKKVPDKNIERELTENIITNLRGYIEVFLVPKWRWSVYKHFDIKKDNSMRHAGISISEGYIGVLCQYQDKVINKIFSLNRYLNSPVPDYLNYLWRTFDPKGGVNKNLTNIDNIYITKKEEVRDIAEPLIYMTKDEEGLTGIVRTWTIEDIFDTGEVFDYYIPIKPEDSYINDIDYKLAYNALYRYQINVLSFYERDKFGRRSIRTSIPDKRFIEYNNKEMLSNFFNGKNKFLHRHILTTTYYPSRYLLSMPVDIEKTKAYKEAIKMRLDEKGKKIREDYRLDIKNDPYTTVLINKGTLPKFKDPIAYIIIAREPIVHQGSIMAVRPIYTRKVKNFETGEVIEDAEIPVGALGIHPTLCKSFNADFDGDTFLCIFITEKEKHLVENIRRQTVLRFHGRGKTDEEVKNNIKTLEEARRLLKREVTITSGGKEIKVNYKDIDFLLEAETLYPLINETDLMNNERIPFEETERKFKYPDIFRSPLNISNLVKYGKDYACIENHKLVYGILKVGYMRKLLTYHLQGLGNGDAMEIANIASVESGMGKKGIAIDRETSIKNYFNIIKTVYSLLKMKKKRIITEEDKKKHIQSIIQKTNVFELAKEFDFIDRILQRHKNNIIEGIYTYGGLKPIERILRYMKMETFFENYNEGREDELYNNLIKRKTMF